MNYTYNWQAQPYVSWKGPKNTGNSAVPSYSRPLTGLELNPSPNGGNDFRARPIKQWRKQLNPASGSGRGRAGIGMPSDTPGGSVYLASATPDCLVCETLSTSNANGIKTYIPADNTSAFPGVNTYDPSNNKMECTACNPETLIIKSAVTLLNKKYYSDTQAYLHSRGQTYDQKLSSNPVAGITYFNAAGQPIWPSNSPAGTQVRATQNCPTNCPVSTAPYGVTTIYKPNNSKFATQGAVSSSTRLLRLQKDTITKNGYSFNSALGAAAANAGKYQGTSTAPYFLKSKYSKCVPTHRNGDHTVCFTSTAVPAEEPSAITSNISVGFAENSDHEIIFRSNAGGSYTLDNTTIVNYSGDGNTNIIKNVTCQTIDFNDATITYFIISVTYATTLTNINLPLLQEFSCWGNQLTELPSFSACVQLQIFSCWGNRLTELPSFSACDQLQLFDCGYNQLTGTVVNNFIPNLPPVSSATLYIINQATTISITATKPAGWAVE